MSLSSPVRHAGMSRCGVVSFFCLAALLQSAEPASILPNGGYAGREACATCHPAETRKHASTPMIRALELAGEAKILIENPLLTSKQGRYSYTIRREGAASVYSVTDGKDTVSAPVLYAFGQGNAGQTYVFQLHGAYFESRVSYYKSLRGLDLTIGAQNNEPQNIEQAAGRRMDAADTRECFFCHNTGVIRENQLRVDLMERGIGCETCHGPSALHAAAMKAGKPADGPMKKLAALSAEQGNDLCGSCHRTWEQIAMMGIRGVNTVRFQPYRITLSKCYDADDRRIACVACHDPHSVLEKSAAYYDAKCAACHGPAGKTGAAKTCRQGTKDCAGCHMPRYEMPGSNHAFVDHRIRVAKPGERYPE